MTYDPVVMVERLETGRRVVHQSGRVTFEPYKCVKRHRDLQQKTQLTVYDSNRRRT